MKANRKFLQEEEAVSPVIAVILMVAITVVLAATVFVLVNDLGKNVGQTGPSLGLVSDSAQSSTSQWSVKVSSATKLSDLTDYRFVVTTAQNGVMVYTPADNTFAAFSNEGNLSRPAGTTDRGEFSDAAPGGAAGAFVGYQIRLTDIDGNAKWSVGDVITLVYDSTAVTEAGEAGVRADANANNFDDAFPAGEYSLEILHIPSGSSSASLPRTF